MERYPMDKITEQYGLPVRGAKVLIIDDNPHNLRMISDFLEGPEFNILVAEDGESGLERAGYVLPDIILLDVLMPGIDGFETCRRLKAQKETREIPVIFMTALSEAEHKVKAFQTGAVDYITKPFHKEEVLARLMVHLRIRELTSGLREAKASLEKRVAERTAQLAEANETLTASEYQLDRIINSVGDPIFVKDRQHRWILLNDAFCSFTGYSREMLIGKSDYDFFPRHEADEFLAGDEIVFNTGKENINEEHVTNAKGIVRTVLTKKTRYIDEKGAAYIVGITRDVTDSKILEAQLRQAAKMEAIGTLAGGVAHDFNNLITVIIGHSELLLRDMDDTPTPLNNGIRQIKRAGESAAALTRQLLTFSRKQVIQPQSVNVNTALAQIRKMLGRIIGEDIEVTTILSPDLWNVISDPALIEQIVMNLAINARDAMPNGGKLTIETSNIQLDNSYTDQHAVVMPGNYVMLAVSDTGSGMDAETQSHIFEPFFTTKEKGKGTGLGLATVFGIVKQNNGHIWVYSEPGCGTTFKIYLPQAEIEIMPEESDDQVSPISGGSETILVVEDNNTVRSLIKNILISYGYQILDAAEGQSALQLLDPRKESIDLLITDVVMPGMGGRQVARAITEKFPRIKTLYVSGYTGKAITHHGVLESGTAFLQKPFSPMALVKKVRQILDEKTNGNSPRRIADDTDKRRQSE